MIPKLIAFDVDKTLTRSKSPVTDEMAALLTELLDHTSVAITSGGTFSQLKGQLADRLLPDAHLERFFIAPTSGAALFAYIGGEWKTIYEELLSEEEAQHIMKAVEEGARSTGIIDFDSQSYGPRIEYRRTQVTLSALGQAAPVEEKEVWDPDGSKRDALRDSIAALLPEYDVKRGGATSIDVTKHGVNKAYGIEKLSTYTKISIPEMLYIGDALFPGGNDEVVKETGIPTKQTSGPEETAAIIKGILS